MIKRHLHLLAGMVLLALIFQSCATIFGSKSNTLTINSEKQDSLAVYIDDQLIGYGPGKVKVGSRVIQHGSKLTIKDGDIEQTHTLIRKPHTFYFVADVLLGGVPLGIDYSTGQIHRPFPRVIEFNNQTNNE